MSWLRKQKPGRYNNKARSLSEATTTQFPIATFSAVCLLAFAVLFEYELARAPVESMYLARYGSTALPYAWMAVGVGVTLTVITYNALVRHFALGRLFWMGSLLSAALVSALLTLRQQIPHTEMLLFVWKDIHVVVLLEMLWTVANRRFVVGDAKWTYGMICFVGSLGSLSGGNTASYIAEASGTKATLAATIPCLVLLASGAWVIGKSRIEPGRGPRPTVASLQVLQRSAYVRTLLALIIVIQIAITLIDYEFNSTLEATFHDQDQRTAIIGKVYSYIAAISMALQLGAGVLMRVAGVTGVLILVPTVLTALVGIFAIAPKLALMITTKVGSKAMDYSIFRAAKEILYIPMSTEEKVQGKAVIDMFGYRVGKVGASLLVLALVSAEPSASVTFAVLILIVVWFALTVPLVRQFRAKTSSGSGQ